MTRIQSLEDLAQAKAAALQKQETDRQTYRFQLRVGMASCSLAAGAQETWDTLQQQIAAQNLTYVQLTKTGCNGLCVLEPVIQVQETLRPPVTYGRVTPEVVRRIVNEHLEKGLIVQEYVIENV